MHIITRYILSELLKVFLLTLSGMTLLIFIALIGKEAVDNGLGLGPLLRMTPYMLPQAMQFAVPGTMLLATTSVYGRMSASNEIVAAKSLGISPSALLFPTLALATLVSFGAVLLNDTAVSWGRLGVQRIFIESFEEVVYGRLDTRGSFSNKNFYMKVQGVEGDVLKLPWLQIHQGSGKSPITISAQEATISSDPTKGILIFSLTNFEVSGNGHRGIDPGTYVQEIHLADILGISNKNRSISTYALREIHPAVAKQEEAIKQQEEEMTTELAFALLMGNLKKISPAEWEQNTHQLKQKNNTLHRLNTEPHRRWSTAFSCLCFVMIGAPMAIWRRHGEFLASFFACFLPILIAYYPLLIVSVDKAKSGAAPPAIVWTGNLVLVIWGFWMMRKVIRH